MGKKHSDRPGGRQVKSWGTGEKAEDGAGAEGREKREGVGAAGGEGGMRGRSQMPSRRGEVPG